MPDVVRALGRHEEREHRRHQLADVVERTRPGGAQERLQFGERHFDRIEVGTVGRQKFEPRARACDRGLDLRLLVHGQVVEHNDIARSERRCEHLLHVGAKAGVVDRPIEDGRRCESVWPQGGDNRVRLPVAAGRVIVQAHAAETAPVSTQEIGRDAAFIEIHVLPGVAQRQPVAPAAPLSGHVGAPLFVGVERFF